MALLEINNLVKSFGGVTATNDVSLSVNENSVHSIIGPNGAGKSTLLNQMIGGLKPDSGSITFDGQSLIGKPPHKINQTGIARVFQSPEIFGGMTLLENVTIAALAARDGSFKFNFWQHPRRRGEQVTIAEQCLEEVGLLDQAHQDAESLARGDKRRLELGLCLAHQPRLLLLDEPTAGMSQQDSRKTTELLQKLAEKGMTKVVIEHDMKVVFALSDEITVMHQGAVISHGTPDEVRDDDTVQEAYLGGAEE